MKQHLKRRLPFALWTGLVFLIGIRFGFDAINLSSDWQAALLITAMVVVASAPDMVVWLRARRTKTRGDAPSNARV